MCWPRATRRAEAARARVTGLEQGAGRLLRRRELAQARDHYALAEDARTLARQQADRAADREREARRADLEQRRHQCAARQAVERLQTRQRAHREQRASTGMSAPTPTSRALGRSTEPTGAGSPRTDERERGGREREAG
jgi:hypothetical protein